MNSKHVSEKLSAYLDKMLDTEEMLAVEEHLQGCAECRMEYESLQETVHALSSLEEMIPPAGFRRELRAKLEKNAVKKRLVWPDFIPGWMRNIKRAQLVPLAAALVLMMVIIPFVGSNMPKSLSKVANDSGRELIGGFSGGGSATAPTAPAAPAPMAAPAGDELARNQVMMDMAATEESGEVALRSSDIAYKMAENQAIAPIEPAPPQTMPEMQEDIERKIIKNADVSLEVDDFTAAVETLKQKITAAGGYIANENVNTNRRNDAKSGYMQVRLPAVQFENFMTGMDTLGTVRNRNIYTQDVTEEYVDVQSRLKAMRVKEERLLDILTKSGQLSDILAVENELANTRANLESLEGRLRYLSNRVDYSSISINIEEVAVSTQQISNPGIGDVLRKTREAFIQTINSILLGIGNLVIYIGAAIPYLVLLIIAGALVWLGIRKARKNQ
ncbi:MAG: DUF4349 domain-containing protein [Clostridia bacterium]|jgi:anti-sigma factor RsiW|nr:DUF4349 domain-containing protein [Clostridia bacterium]